MGQRQMTLGFNAEANTTIATRRRRVQFFCSACGRIVGRWQEDCHCGAILKGVE